MYMNCAVVDITNKKQSKRDTQASAAKALARYPELFVANLANINSCKVQETTDVIFDTPGKQVAYGNGDNASMKPSFGKGQCTGKPSKNAGSASPASNSGGSSSGGGNSGQWTPDSNSGGGNNGQWTAPKQSTSSSSGCTAAKINSGSWYPECANGLSGTNARTVQQQQQPAQQQQAQQSKQDAPKSSTQKSIKKKPNTKVQQQLDAYLASLPPSRLVRRNIATHLEEYADKSPAQIHEHVHTKDCKHKAPAYPAGSHYHNTEDLDPYPEDGVDYSNRNVYKTQDSQNHEGPESSYKRASRQKRWMTYDKRQAVTNKAVKYYRPGSGESAYYQQQAAAQAQATQAADQASAQSTAQTSNLDLKQKQTSTDASAQSSTEDSAQTVSDPPAQKSYWDMTDQEKFDAFLRRMVELSTNMAALIKYAAASSLNPSIPYYPPASTYDRTETSTDATAQEAAASRRLARRGVIYPYPGPAVGPISASGEATDAEDGFKAWFPNLVHGLMKRQLIDPITSPASAASGDGINFFDALLAGLWKALGDPFNLYGDDPATDPVPPPDSSDAAAPDASDVPLLLGEPDVYSNDDFPDFSIPDLDGDFIFPPSIMAPEPPVPELLPGYEVGSDGLPVWVGDGPDPLASDLPAVVITIDPFPTDPDVFPGEAVPTLQPCVAPIPQVGFNSCLGGCNHTAEEIAAHDVYLQDFAAEQAAYEACLQNQGLDGVAPPAGILPGDIPLNETTPSEAEDASHRRPRPGMSHPLIPYPLPDNFTGPFPSNSTGDAPSDVAAPYPLLNATTLDNGTAPVELQPYENKTLGELVSEIVKDPDVLGPVIVDTQEEEEEEEGDAPVDGGVPEDAPVEEVPSQEVPALTPTLSDPSPADSPSDTPSQDPSETPNPLQEAADQAEQGVTAPTDPIPAPPNALESIADALPWFMGPGPVVVSPPVATRA